MIGNCGGVIQSAYSQWDLPEGITVRADAVPCCEGGRINRMICNDMMLIHERELLRTQCVRPGYISGVL